MRLVALIAAVVLAGCQTGVSKEELESTNYGPKPARYREVVLDYLNPRIPDPKAAIITFRTEPKQMVQRETMFRNRQWGWAVCVWINENHPRGYQGIYPMTFFFRDEKIVNTNGGPDDSNVIGARYARDQCEQLGSPFDPVAPDMKKP